jgi:hypothetical protein
MDAIYSQIDRFCRAITTASAAMICGAACMSAHAKAQSLTGDGSAYHTQLLIWTEPTYELAKVNRLVARLRANAHDLDQGTNGISAKEFQALSVPAKFTYTMLHGDVYFQLDDSMPGDSGDDKLIFAYPIGVVNGNERWSARQRSFLYANRRAVIGLLRDTIRLKREAGFNLRNAIVEIDAYELIPDLVSVYPKGRDADMLTTFCILMKNGRFKPFTDSASYRKMFGSESTKYKASIAYNPANEKLTIERATAYYKSRSD